MMLEKENMSSHADIVSTAMKGLEFRAQMD
jgi:hypothetical protein